MIAKTPQRMFNPSLDRRLYAYICDLLGQLEQKEVVLAVPTWESAEGVAKLLGRWAEANHGLQVGERVTARCNIGDVSVGTELIIDTLEPRVIRASLADDRKHGVYCENGMRVDKAKSSAGWREPDLDRALFDHLHDLMRRLADDHVPISANLWRCIQALRAELKHWAAINHGLQVGDLAVTRAALGAYGGVRVIVISFDDTSMLVAEESDPTYTVRVENGMYLE